MIYLLYTTVELVVKIVNQLSHLGGLQGPTESILDMGRMGDMTKNSEETWETWVVQSVYFVAFLMWVDPNRIPFLPKVGQGTFGLNSLIHDCLIYPLVNCHIAMENPPSFKT
jgi:hypothetical protein